MTPQNELLLALNIVIQQNGGAEKYAHDIECEWVKMPMQKAEPIPNLSFPLWNKDEYDLLVEMYKSGNDINYICLALKRSKQSIWTKLHSLRKKNIVGRRRSLPV